MGKLRRPELPPGPLDELVRELHALHARAGWPSTRELARGQNFSYTAVHDLFTKTTTEPPKLPVLHRVVERLATMAPRTDLEKTLDRFDALWLAADKNPVLNSTKAAVEEIELTPATELISPESLGAHVEGLERGVFDLVRQGKSGYEIIGHQAISPDAYRIALLSLISKWETPPRACLTEAPKVLAQLRSALSDAPPAIEPALTRELLFVAREPEPLHDATAELRRAGLLIRDQPREINDRWRLTAYSAASKLSREYLAALDDMADRYGFNFDGWSTYVGPPELDDGPGKPQRGEERDRIEPSSVPLFRTGTVLTSPKAVKRMRMRGVGQDELVRRHTHGDWGELSPEEILDNERAVRTGQGGIFSGYGEGSERLLVVTEPDRSVTRILTPKEL
jgi:hypothetical protein